MGTYTQQLCELNSYRLNYILHTVLTCVIWKRANLYLLTPKVFSTCLFRGLCKLIHLYWDTRNFLHMQNY
ncbi:hypothetical protein BGX38DRAFT_1159661 [Terfezia claveryi]|nr:hypothetical protein BGX38DRAFT_1159661 [Terfezia claveryi]